MEINKEYESLAKFTADLSNLLQHNIVTISGRLLAKGLVTKDVHDSMLTTEGVSSQRNAARLISCVLDRVKCSSRCFHDFISVLREDAYFEDVALKIVGVHTLLQSSSAAPTSEDPTPSSPPPSSAICTVAEPSSNVSVVIERLDKQYIEIEQLVFKTIKRRKVPLEDILTWIRFPPVTLRNRFADLVHTQLKLLANVSSIDELFFLLSSYGNSFHPDLLVYLISKLEDTDLKAQMDHYMQDLHRFRVQTTLGDFLDKWVGKIPSGYLEFVLELGEEWREKTVEDFEQFRISLSRLQCFGGGHMPFMKMAKSSSVVIVLALPAHLFPLNLRQKAIHKVLKDRSIVRMMVDGQYVYDSKKLADCERELLKLCIDKCSNIIRIKHLLNEPAVDPNFYDEEGISLIWLACNSGQTNIVTILLDSGADVNLENDREDGETPLICSCFGGYITVCKVLLERGATVDLQGKQGFTALHAASQEGRKDVVELLLDSGASVDKPKVRTGGSPLMVACEFGHIEVAGVLIARGAAVNFQNKYSSTPLTMAAEKGHRDVCQLLVQHGADVNHQEPEDGWSVLHYASAYGHPSIVELFIKSGAHLNVQTKDHGMTVLAWAAYNGHTQIVDILLNAGASPDIQDQDGLTALMLATHCGHKEVIKSLLEKKANPNITDMTAGRSAIFFAVENGDVKIAHLLVSGGADVDLKDKNDLTALDTAKLYNQKDVYKFLQKHSRSGAGKDITEEQRQRATTFTKRLRKVFDNLKWMFLRGRVLKQVEQASREFPSPDSTELHHQGK